MFQVLVLFGIIIFLILLKNNIYVLKDWERAIIIRLGKISRVAGPGVIIVIPFLERIYRIVDVRVRAAKIYINNLFTKDNTRISLEAIIYWRIKDPIKYIYLKDPSTTIRNLFIGEVRDLISSLYLDEVMSNIDKINDFLSEKIRYESWKWGIQVDSIQITKIKPSERIARAIEDVMIARQRLLANRFIAEARRILLKALGEAANKLNDQAILYLYMQALKELGKSPSSKMLIPMEFFGGYSNIEDEIARQLKGINMSQLLQMIKNVLEKEEK